MKKNRSVFMIIFGIFIFLTFSINAHSWILINYSECSFEKEGRFQIEEKIITGASNFLQSYSEILILFQKIEMAKFVQIDYAELQMMVDEAIVHMENARDAYSHLNQMAVNTPYEQNVIYKLAVFDYAQFQIKRSLNKDGMAEVTNYLPKGDVIGVYNQVWSKVEKILNHLYLIKDSIDSHIIPEYSLLWDLNKLYSKTLLFGQNVAKIFFEITGK